MATKKHIKILKQGVEVWNQWRDQNAEERPNFNDANLSGTVIMAAMYIERKPGTNLSNLNLKNVDLHEADLNRTNLIDMNLSRANLVGAHLINANLISTDLSHANLSMANLSSAVMIGSDLTGANLSGARLIHADLAKANLSEAILTNASLESVNFTGANLKGVDFSGAIVQGALFTNNDLSMVKGLEAIRHWGPSTVGIDTIYQSKGSIPEAFLRGAGVPDNFIDYMASLAGRAFEFYSCFISYSSKNQQFADRIYADLQSKGVRCWFAPEDLRIGDKTRIAIDESIRTHDKLLLILSKYSVNSEWVEQEVETALAREREEKRLVLFPIRLDDTVMEIKSGWPALIKNSRHIGDFKKWKDHDAYQKALHRLTRDLKT